MKLDFKQAQSDACLCIYIAFRDLGCRAAFCIKGVVLAPATRNLRSLLKELGFSSRMPEMCKGRSFWQHCWACEHLTHFFVLPAGSSAQVVVAQL